MQQLKKKHISKFFKMTNWFNLLLFVVIVTIIAPVSMLLQATAIQSQSQAQLQAQPTSLLELPKELSRFAKLDKTAASQHRTISQLNNLNNNYQLNKPSIVTQSNNNNNQNNRSPQNNNYFNHNNGFDSNSNQLHNQHDLYSLHNLTTNGDLMLSPQLNSSKRRPEKICIGTSNRMSGQHNKTDHYQNLVERYKNCTYVMGNLEITWLEATSFPSQQELDLSFLENIREITGYLLIGYVKVDRIRMPNLQIIRGRDLFKLNKADQKEEFAMFLIQNELKSLELPNLREILTGSVGFFDNSNLRYERSIDWDEILNPGYGPVFNYNSSYEHRDVQCDSSCQRPNCWGEGPELCQKFSKVTCSPQCSQGRCFGSLPRECCHLFCAGGCTGPKQTDCLACKNFYDDGECIQECPSMNRYDSEKLAWLLDPRGKYAFGATCVKECPEHLLRDNGACVRTCPPNKRSINGECTPCTGPCPKNCTGVDVVHSGNIDQFINCTIIEGSLKILDTTFSGYVEFHNNTIGNRYEPMSPSRLNVFKTIREITGYLSVQANHSEFRDLSYFKNLRTIGGRELTDKFCSLEIIKTSLQWLGLQSLSKIRVNKITIEENKALCFTDTIDWVRTGIIKSDGASTIRNNADVNECKRRGLSCNPQCTRDGCWGPGPDQCVACNNYRLDDFCVDNCTSTYKTIGLLSFPATTSNISLASNGFQESSLSPNGGHGKVCQRCHSECQSACHGPGANNCLDCKNVKDNGFCVAECPAKKFNDRGLCKSCHASCLDSCTGPSSRLGEGGCKTCGKAIVLNDTVINCIKSDELCPDGYYQEYVSPQMEQQLHFKLPMGRPICRKCHSRCKRCLAMGTHTSVCECSKYAVGEQCEDSCPRDYYADEKLQKCTKCSHECNGCFGPTEADCHSCRVYRIYHDATSPTTTHISLSPTTNAIITSATTTTQPSAQKLIVDKGSLLHSGSNTTIGMDLDKQQQRKFNCTSQCPPEKPHRISDNLTPDPYCSDRPSLDSETTTGTILYLLSSKLVVFTILFILFGFCFAVYKLKKYKTVQKLTMRLSGFDEDVEPLNQSNVKPNLAPLRSIKETELRKGNILGSGFGGTVYQGTWNSEHASSWPVAIKVLRDQPNKNKEFLDEAYMMASVNHPNLVRLLGVCMTPNQLMLVTPLMIFGNLLDHVHKYENAIDSKLLLEFSKQIAQGMNYLEGRRMVHRDLALRNVLLKTMKRVVISDFGLAKCLDVDQSEYQSGGGKLPVKWLAPECMKDHKFTHKSDVWAFGVTIWELLTYGQKPFEEYGTGQLLLIISEGARLRQPKYVSAEIYKEMYSCWFFNPEDRPNFKYLAEKFSKFAQDPDRYLDRMICAGKKGYMDTLGYNVSTNGMAENNSDSESFESESESDINSLNSPNNVQASNDQMINNNNTMRHDKFDLLLNSDPQVRRLDSESESNNNQNPHTSRQHLIDQDVFMSSTSNNNIISTSSNNNSNNNNNNLQLTDSRTSTAFITDINGNHTFRASTGGGSAWSSHHTVSSTRSEQAVDEEDYLMPSPAIFSKENKFFKISTTTSHRGPSSGRLAPGSSFARDPPHSAGLIGITNEEYFMAPLNYTNHNGGTHSSTNASSTHIPNSLV